MKAQVNLGRIAGIAVGLHYSWFIIALLIVLSLAQHFRAIDPNWTPAMTWTSAVITGVLFFLTLLLHELAHSLVAKARGLRVRSITLFALGGVSQIESEASDAKSEFWIAIAGPITSVVIGVVLLAVVRVTAGAATSEPASPVAAVLLWLGYINIMLAAFNMIPGYPLDGGRVLRAVFWWTTHSAERATKLAARVGQIVAFLFILFGLIRFFFGANFGGLWLAFIGWFLLDAARSSYVQSEFMAALRNRRVSDMMDRDFATVEGHLSLDDFVSEYVLRTGRRCFVVTQNGRVSGLITTRELTQVDRAEWAHRSVQSAMRPLAEMRTVTPAMPAIDALELMTREDVNQLPVLSDGALQGVFSRARVLSFLRTRAEIRQRAA